MLFDWVVRRHHCRRCGNVFCDTCACKKALLPSGSATRNIDKEQEKIRRRVCLQCFDLAEPQQDVLALQFVAELYSKTAKQAKGAH